VQYHAPLFRALAECGDLDFEVAFAEVPKPKAQGRGFGLAFEWDVPILEGYRWTVMPTQPLAPAISGRRVVGARRRVRELRADVLLLTGWQTLPLVQALLAAGDERLPVLMRGESSGLKARRALVRSVHRYLLRRIDAFLVIGQANRDFYESYGIARSQLFDAPYFVDNERFTADADRWRPRRDELREKFGVPPGATCFLFAGKFERKKHPEHLLQGLARLRAQKPSLSVHGLFVGDGALSGRLRDTTCRHQLSVSFAGFLNQTEIAKAYVSCDALVLPSDYDETWGLVVNEAMACGVTALVSDRVGCGPDLVAPGLTGERYPFWNIEAMARILEDWALAPSRVAELGRAARERVLSRYTVARSTAAVVDATAAILRSRAA